MTIVQAQSLPSNEMTGADLLKQFQAGQQQYRNEMGGIADEKMRLFDAGGDNRKLQLIKAAESGIPIEEALKAEYDNYLQALYYQNRATGNRKSLDQIKAEADNYFSRYYGWGPGGPPTDTDTTKTPETPATPAPQKDPPAQDTTDKTQPFEFLEYQPPVPFSPAGTSSVPAKRYRLVTKSGVEILEGASEQEIAQNAQSLRAIYDGEDPGNKLVMKLFPGKSVKDAKALAAKKLAQMQKVGFDPFDSKYQPKPATTGKPTTSVYPMPPASTGVAPLPTSGVARDRGQFAPPAEIIPDQLNQIKAKLVEWNKDFPETQKKIQAATSIEQLKGIAKEGMKALGFKDGGKISSPTLALIGEGGEREYVVPESKARQWAMEVLQGKGSPPNPAGIQRMAGGGVSESKHDPEEVQFVAQKLMEGGQAQSPQEAMLKAELMLDERERQRAYEQQSASSGPVVPINADRLSGSNATFNRGPSTPQSDGGQEVFSPEGISRKMHEGDPAQVDPSLTTRGLLESGLSRSQIIASPLYAKLTPQQRGLLDSDTGPGPDEAGYRPDRIESLDTNPSAIAKSPGPDRVVYAVEDITSVTKPSPQLRMAEDALRGLPKESKSLEMVKQSRSFVESVGKARESLEKRIEEAKTSIEAKAVARKALPAIIASPEYKDIRKELATGFKQWFDNATPEELSLLDKDAANLRHSGQVRKDQLYLGKEELAIKNKLYNLEKEAAEGKSGAATIMATAQFAMKYIESQTKVIEKKGAAKARLEDKTLNRFFNFMETLLNVSETVPVKTWYGAFKLEDSKNQGPVPDTGNPYDYQNFE